MNIDGNLNEKIGKNEKKNIFYLYGEEEEEIAVLENGPTLTIANDYIKLSNASRRALPNDLCTLAFWKDHEIKFSSGGGLHSGGSSGSVGGVDSGGGLKSGGGGSSSGGSCKRIDRSGSICGNCHQTWQCSYWIASTALVAALVCSRSPVVLLASEMPAALICHFDSGNPPTHLQNSSRALYQLFMHQHIVESHECYFVNYYYRPSQVLNLIRSYVRSLKKIL